MITIFVMSWRYEET